MKRTRFTQEQLEYFKQQYENGKSITSLQKEINISRHIIARELKEYLKLEKLSNRKYSVNEKYFENIDNREKAYWLGFIAADGCVCHTGGHEKGSKVLVFNLNERDKEHLEKFLIAIGSEAQIKTKPGVGYGEGTVMVSLEINSKKIVEDLNKFGITERKSLTLQPPNIDPQFYIDWIRGYFDGDGSIMPRISNGNGQISFEGTKEVLDFIQDCLRPDKRIKLQQGKKKNNHYSFSYGGTYSVFEILKKFYNKDVPVYLNRKYEKVLEFYSRFEK